MNELKIFSNSDFGELSVMVIAGKEYFPATQCAKILGYADPFKAIKQHCDDEGCTKRSVLTNSGTQEMKFITEGNLYRLIVRSKLPAAKKFEHWVFDEVLPEIRRTGGYGSVDIEAIVARAVSETVKVLIPYLTGTSEKPAPELMKRTRKRRRYTTPSKISTLPPELKHQVDEMIMSGEYSCQKIAFFIMNNSDIEISQMAVNRYRHMNFQEVL